MVNASGWHLRFTKSLSQVASVVVFLIGWLVLVGWALESETLKSLVPGLVTMKANTALAFVLIGLALWILHDEEANQRRRRLAEICALAVFLIGLLTLIEYLFAWDLGIDEIIFRDTAMGSSLSPPGRMAEASAFSLFLIGMALWLLGKSKQYLLIDVIALVVLGISLLALVGYLYGVASLYGVFVFTSVALQTALALLISSIGILFARPAHGLMAVLITDAPGGAMARRLLPAAFVVPLLLGWLRLRGQHLGLYGTEFGLALFALSNILVFTLLIWWNAHLLNGADTKRRQAEAQVRKLNRVLAILSDINQAIVRIRDLPTHRHQVKRIE